MKKWGNDVKVGDAIWYEDLYCFKHSTVVEIDYKTFRMPSLIMENNDRLFVNQYYYTDKSDITNDMIDDMLLEAKAKQFEWGEEISILQTKIDTITKQINDLEKFKNE